MKLFFVIIKPWRIMLLLDKHSVIEFFHRSIMLKFILYYYHIYEQEQYHEHVLK